jgi:hypothetical protein
VGDTEVDWRLADVLAAQSKFEESEARMKAARSGFDSLLEHHLLAFADHGAEFYAGSGNDCLRALQLARINADNRPTLRAQEQARNIAASADVAGSAPTVCDTVTLARFVIGTAKTSFEKSGRGNGMIIDRRTFVAGTTSIALAPALDLLPVQLRTPETPAAPLVLMIDGWTVPGESSAADAVWIRIGHSWRTVWR